MIFQEWAVIAVFIAMVSSLILLITQNWRYYVVALAVQYLAVFWLITLAWPIGLASVKLVVGWMAAAVLGASHLSQDFDNEKARSASENIFRLLAAMMVWIVTYSIVPAVATWIPAGFAVLWGGMLLIGMGLLQLGMTTRPLRVVVGLLTVFSGFEVLYAVVETSVLLTGLLAIVNLCLALVGAYLVGAETLEVAD